MDVHGLLITKDDHEAFGDWCRDQLPFYKAVICLDGSESDDTARQAEQYPERLIYLHERDFDIASKGDHGLRRIVHNELIQRFGANIWIMCCHTDEFCYHDPRKITARAEREGFDQVSWFSPHFFPHPTEFVDLSTRIRLPIQERFRHFHWSHLGNGFPWIEDRLYKSARHVSWDQSTHGSVRPHGLRRPAPFHPIYRHFKVCSIDLSAYDTGNEVAHYRNHWPHQAHRTGLSYRVEKIEDLFVTAVRKYSCCTRFDGRFDQPWNIGEEYRPDVSAPPETTLGTGAQDQRRVREKYNVVPSHVDESAACPNDDGGQPGACRVGKATEGLWNPQRDPLRASVPAVLSGRRVFKPVVQIVGPTDSWILEQLARRLASKLPYAVFTPFEPRRDLTAGLAYYVNYAMYQGPTSLIDVGFFTHRDDDQMFLRRAQDVDFAVCMSKMYADWLLTQGVTAVAHIPMGFDYYRYRPRLVVGVVGRLEHPRKGADLVTRVRSLPFVEVRTTEGRVNESLLRDFYQALDYVLIPATVEGGPMSLLEGLCSGIPLIAPHGVGIVPEFSETQGIKRYPAGDGDALIALLTQCHVEKCAGSQFVRDRTWDHWAESHHHLFRRLLLERGIRFPEPAAGFRFGMLSELEIPLGVETSELEATIDQFAAHLYFGRYTEARSILANLGPELAFAKRLIETIPTPSARKLSRESSE